ncbi:MAG: T9SS type A sorting domain-containing protein [Candidatus Kapabacteria bacterium]|nr:T9SS type A sorting domain-containing protein [Candidatus Kapabacteria bacterium]
MTHTLNAIVRAALVLTVVAIQGTALHAQHTTPISSVLDEHGRIRTERIHGSATFSAEGYTLSPASQNDAPVFTPKQAAVLDQGDANWDAQFGTAVNEQVQITTIAVYQEKIYIGGFFRSFAGILCNSIIMWDGGLWQAVGGGVTSASGNNAGTVSAITVDTKGMVYVGGIFERAGSNPTNNIAQWNGKVWLALDDGVTGSVNALAALGDKVYVGGNFSVGSAVNIAEWDGSKWNMMKNITSGAVNAIVASGTSIYIGGAFKTIDAVTVNNIAQWNEATKSWTPLGAGLSNQGSSTSSVKCLQLTTSGDLLAGGDFELSGTTQVRNIAIWNGSVWAMFAGGTNGSITALYYDNGKLYVSGGFDEVGTSKKKLIYLARFDGTEWSGMDNDNVNGTAAAFADFNGNILMGGTFEITVTSTYSLRGVAVWNGSAWTGVGGSRGIGIEGNVVTSITPDGNGNIYVGGNFTGAGGVSLPGFALFDGTTWMRMDTLKFSNNSNSGVISAIQGGDIIVGGSFALPNLNQAGIVRYNPTTQTATPLCSISGNLGGRRVNKIAVRGNSIYVAGAFRGVNADTSRCIAMYDGTSWKGFNGGATGVVSGGNTTWISALEFDQTGSMYVGGNFTSIGGVAANGLAVWDGTSFSAVGSGITGSQFTFVGAIASIGDLLLVGGNFTTIGGIASRNIALWNKTTKTWTAIGANNSVNSFYVEGDYVLIGGDFDTLGGIAASRIIRYNYKTGAFDRFGSGTDGAIFTIAPAHGGIYVGGSFSSAGRKGSSRIARWNRGLTSVEENEPVAATQSLMTNAPNPASSLTTLNFTVNTPQHTSIRVYTSTGIEVATLLDAPLAAGLHSVDWDASQQPSGVYYARLQAGKTITTRMVVITR